MIFMSPKTKEEVRDSIAKRYSKASFKEKGIILNEFCETCGYSRKHAIAILNSRKKVKKKKKKRGKKPKYSKDNKEFIIALKRIWLEANLPCSKRFKSIIPLWLPFYAERYEALSGETMRLLLGVSAASIDRLLKPSRTKYGKRGLSTTKPGSIIRKHIPIKTNQWDESRPGFLEADTVAHCGTSVEGTFIFTLDTVDIATSWTEQRAIWGKGAKSTLEQIKDIETTLPFKLLGFDSDNGTEFINYHLLRYFLKRSIPIEVSRTRAYRKNDNAHIEQKNWTHVRQWIGYERLDKIELVALLNAMYKSEWRLFHNFFCPSMKLLDKKRIGTTVKKKFDSPKTPYQRVLESNQIDKSIKESLRKQFQELNPFKLRQTIERKLDRVFKTLKELKS
jgi:hypothetical protein